MKRSAVLLSALALLGVAGCNKPKSSPPQPPEAGASPAAVTSSRTEPIVIPGSAFGSNFEGEMTLQIADKGDKAPKTFVVRIKSPKVRADLSAFARNNNPLLAPGASMLFDPSAKKEYVLVPEKKLAMVIDLERVKQQRAAAAPPAGSNVVIVGGPKIDKTGKTQVVAGYGCEIWKLTSTTGSHADLCMAEGLKLAALPSLAGGSAEFATMKELDDANYFPLSAVAFDKANVETSRMEAKKIEKKPLPDADFVVPSDYQQLDMTQGIVGGRLGSAPPGDGHRH